MSLAEKITDAELEIMKILWREREPVDYTSIRIELQELKGWEKTTISTLLKRLADKGVINIEKRKVMYYAPNITEAEYVQSQEQAMIDKLYGGSAKSLVASLFQKGKLTETDIDELREYFNIGGEGT